MIIGKKENWNCIFPFDVTLSGRFITEQHYIVGSFELCCQISNGHFDTSHILSAVMVPSSIKPSRMDTFYKLIIYIFFTLPSLHTFNIETSFCIIHDEDFFAI